MELGVLPIIYAVMFDRRSLKIDYFLLITFLAFSGQLDEDPEVQPFGSNVPNALLFADFTSNWRALLWGVSVGGYGNLIGSLANFISYRFYKVKHPNTRDFMLKFHLYGYLFFSIGIFIYDGSLGCIQLEIIIKLFH